MLLVRQGTKFSPRYVDLFRKFNPITLTDQRDTPGRTAPLIMRKWSGWTSKLELFAPWNERLRPALYVDLDTLITGDISDLMYEAARAEDFWMIREFNPDIKRSESGLMIIPQDTSAIWAAIEKSSTGPQFMDGVFLDQFPHRILNDRFEGIVSYKVHDCREGPKGRICCFHGQPKPHQCGGWVKQIFEGENE